MRRILIGFAVLSAALAAPAFAATTPPGVNLRWDSCYDDGGAANKLFACDTNTGTDRLVLSFVLDTPMGDVSGTETRLEVWSASASMPAWWQLFVAGSCRQQGLTMNMALDPLATNCVDWSNSQSAGGIAVYNIGPLFIGGPGTGMALLRTATAVPVGALAALSPGQEYFMANLNIRHVKTVGTGACAGCDIPVCIVFSQLRVVTATSPVNDRTFILGANNVASQFATWQSGLVVNPHVRQFGVTGGGPRMSMDNCVAAATGNRRPTWGAVKALYR